MKTTYQKYHKYQTFQRIIPDTSDTSDTFDTSSSPDTFDTSSSFTLLEMLVSLGIIAIVGVLLTQVFISTTRTNTKGEITKEVKQNGDFVLGVMTRMLMNARSITSDCEKTGTSASSLTFTNPDGGTTMFACLFDGKAFRIASISASLSFLTSPSVSLYGETCETALTFVCTTLPDETQSIKINFSLAQQGTPYERYEEAGANFQTTVTVRN